MSKTNKNIPKNKYQEHEVIERNRQEFTGKLDNSAIAHYDADLENSKYRRDLPYQKISASGIRPLDSIKPVQQPKKQQVNKKPDDSQKRECNCPSLVSLEELADISHDTIMPFGELFPKYDMLIPYEPQIPRSLVQPYNEHAQGIMNYSSKNNKPDKYDVFGEMDAHDEGIEISQNLNNAVLQYLRNEFDLTNSAFYKRSNKSDK